MKQIFIYFLLLISTSLVAQTSDRFTVINVDANTKNNEFGVILSPDGAIYYSKSSYKNESDFNEKGASLYRGVLEPKGQISKGLKFPAEATHAVFSRDGHTVYYSKKNGNKKFQLYKARIDRTGRWRNSVKLPFNNPNYTFKQPALNQDNTKLFFVSNMPGGLGKNDIYYVNITNNGFDYGEPVNLGEAINSSGNEMYPFIGNKDKLFFSSDGRGGLGGLDIYESFYENGKYVKTSNLEAPINSEKDDFAYVLIPDSNKGYFSSNRIDGFGGVDIYYFQDKKPSLNKCNQSIEGFVKNKKNGKGIFEVTVEIFSSVDHVGTQLTNYKGAFLFDNVECSERYDIVCYKEGWNGFAEVQTIPESGNKLLLYLDTDFPEEYTEEFNSTDEIVVIDTETNKVIKPDTDVNNDIGEEGLSFAEKRERDRIRKERKKKERIEAEREAERIEKQKLREQQLAEAEARRLAADREKNERIEKAKAMAEKLRLEKELADKTEAERVEALRIAEEKQAAKKREEQRFLAEQERQRKLEEAKIAKAEEERLKRIEAERVARELAEQKRLEEEKQAALLAQQQAIEKEREQRIAEAKATAEKLRLAKQAEEKARLEAAAKQKEEEQALAMENAKTENVITDKTENEQAEITETQVTENTSEADEQESEFDKQQALIKKEREQRIAEAKATAEKLRLAKQAEEKARLEAAAKQKEEEQALAMENAKTENVITDKTENKQAETTETQVTENISEADEQESEFDKQQALIKKERKQRIAEAKATAARLRAEQEKAKKEIAQLAMIETQKRAELETNQAYLQDLILQQKKSKRTKHISSKKKLQIQKRELLIKEQTEKVKKLLEEELTTVNKRVEKEKLVENNNKTLINLEKEEQSVAAQIETPDTFNKQETVTYQADNNGTSENPIAKTSEPDLTVENDTKVVSSEAIDQNTFDKKENLEEETTEAESDSKQPDNEEQLDTTIVDKEPEENQNTNTVTTINEERCARTISGLIQNSKSGEGLAGANIDMYYDGQNIESTTADEKGEFHFYNVDCNTTYTLICFKQKFNNIAKAEIDTESLPDQIVLLLEPDPVVETVAMEEPAPEKHPETLPKIDDKKDNTLTKPKYKPTKKETVNTDLPEEKTDTLVAEEEEPKDETLNTEKKEEKIEVPEIKEGKILINPIYFDLDEYYLTLPARRELDKIIVIMRENPTMIIESGSHTDTRGNFDYNLQLSEKRSQEVVGYLVANGADPDRISGRGYGETMPVNHCVDGVKCTEAEHLENRRTEFVILRY